MASNTAAAACDSSSADAGSPSRSTASANAHKLTGDLELGTALAGNPQSPPQHVRAAFELPVVYQARPDSSKQNAYPMLVTELLKERQRLLPEGQGSRVIITCIRRAILRATG